MGEFQRLVCAFKNLVSLVLDRLEFERAPSDNTIYRVYHDRLKLQDFSFHSWGRPNTRHAILKNVIKYTLVTSQFQKLATFAFDSIGEIEWEEEFMALLFHSRLTLCSLTWHFFSFSKSIFDWEFLTGIGTLDQLTTIKLTQIAENRIQNIVSFLCSISSRALVAIFLSFSFSFIISDLSEEFTKIDWHVMDAQLSHPLQLARFSSIYIGAILYLYSSKIQFFWFAQSLPCLFSAGILHDLSDPSSV